jgi:hypothetical protein
MVGDLPWIMLFGSTQNSVPGFNVIGISETNSIGNR